jgi:molybdopterin-guanine dinucleotide biosynthesis protein A
MAMAIKVEIMTDSPGSLDLFLNIRRKFTAAAIDYPSSPETTRLPPHLAGKAELNPMSATDRPQPRAASRGWHYHPHEIVVRSGVANSTLAQDLVQFLSGNFEVGLVQHGPEVEVPLSVSVHRLQVNGQRTAYFRQGHIDLPLQRTLLANADLVVVDGGIDSIGPSVVELPPGQSPLQDLSNLGVGAGSILFGERRPVLSVPPGGVAWFEPSEISELAEHILEQFERRFRERPLWGLALLAHPESHPQSQAWLRSLSSRVERVLVASPDSVSAFESAPDAHTGLGDLGRILSCLEAHPEAAFLVAGGEFEASSEAILEALLARRNPFRVATAIREPDTHLPQRLPALWEPKSRLRIYPALSADLRCPQRILTQSLIELLDPISST